MIWDERIAHWVGVKLFGNPDAFGECRALGVFSKGELIAGVVFHDWNPRHGTIEVSAYAKNRTWFRRSVINEAMRYAFNVAKVQMVCVRTAIDNMPARRIWLALGSDEIIIPRLYGRDKDGALLTLTDDQWAQSKFNSEFVHGQR